MNPKESEQYFTQLRGHHDERGHAEVVRDGHMVSLRFTYDFFSKATARPSAAASASSLPMTTAACTQSFAVSL